MGAILKYIMMYAIIRAVVALGFGIVTYGAILYALNNAINEIRTAYNSMPAEVWAAAGFDDTLLRWQMKPEVVNGEKKDIQSRVQTRGGQTGR